MKRRTNRFACGLGVALWLTGPSDALAQAPGQSTTQDRPSKSTSEAGAAPATLQFLTSAAPKQVQFLAEFSEDKQTGTVSFGWKTGQQAFQLRFSGPVSAGTAEPIALTGLPTGATAGMDWNYLGKSGPSPLEQEEIVRRCRALPASLTADGCTDTDFAEGRERDAFNYLQHLYDSAWLFGLSGEVAHQAFSYVTESSFSPVKSQHAGGTATIRAGIIAPAFASAVVSYTYLKSHKAAGPASDVCRPLGDTGATKCDPTVVGAPTTVMRSIVNFEVRKFFTATTAVSPSVHYDFKNRVTSAALPFYFLNGPAGTAGGVRLGWRSDRKEVTALAFIGGAITAIPR